MDAVDGRDRRESRKKTACDSGQSKAETGKRCALKAGEFGRAGKRK